MFEILTTILPRDSSQLSIPSLSLSISTLSIIPSLSLSSGHILIGISSDSRVSPEQVTIPMSLYVPGMVGVKFGELILRLTNPEVPSSKNQSNSSKLSELAADKMIFGMQFPSVSKSNVKLISGADGNPE